QGSAQVAIAPDGTVTRDAYTPYGVTRGTDELATERGWLGQIEDDTTGLTYLNARYYDPAVGRFLSPDPLMSPGDPRTLDPYRYADNNPVSYTDASGLKPACGATTKCQAYNNAPSMNDVVQGTYHPPAQPAGPSGQGASAAIGDSGTSSWTGAAKGAATTAAQSHVNYLGGMLNGAIDTVNLGLALTPGQHLAGWVTGTGVPHFPSVGIWGDYESQRWFSYLGSGAFVVTTTVLTGGTGLAAIGGRAATTGAKAGAAANPVVGFADEAVGSAYQGMRSGGGHAIRNLRDKGLIANKGSLASQVAEFQQLTSPMLRSPAKTFDWKLGATITRGFAGEAGGSQVVVFVAKEGPYQGRVLSAVVPDAGQMAQWGLP
ncbi:RHS repeat-associated core domain-containing protein, partial [Demequina activiva]|uniref:RHS repeat-associated core domain-containing protein n=1 Tax=Demequina activiva TaxID=1582364 RepID=UPI001941325E